MYKIDSYQKTQRFVELKYSTILSTVCQSLGIDFIFILEGEIK